MDYFIGVLVGAFVTCCLIVLFATIQEEKEKRELNESLDNLARLNELHNSFNFVERLGDRHLDKNVDNRRPYRITCETCKKKDVPAVRRLQLYCSPTCYKISRRKHESKKRKGSRKISHTTRRTI